MMHSCRVRLSTAIPSLINFREVHLQLIYKFFRGFVFAVCCEIGTIYYRLFAVLTQFYSGNVIMGIYQSPRNSFSRILIFLYFVLSRVKIKDIQAIKNQSEETTASGLIDFMSDSVLICELACTNLVAAFCCGVIDTAFSSEAW